MALSSSASQRARHSDAGKQSIHEQSACTNDLKEAVELAERYGPFRLGRFPDEIKQNREVLDAKARWFHFMTSSVLDTRTAGSLDTMD